MPGSVFQSVITIWPKTFFCKIFLNIYFIQFSMQLLTSRLVVFAMSKILLLSTLSNSWTILTLRMSEAGIPALRKLPCGVGSRYTGGTICQRQASEAGIPALFSSAYWHLNARVIEIQTRQQLKNNLSHETQRIFVNKFCIWTPSGQRTS